jgi:glycosyltransferase involved in cell wall biosynthesis
MAHAETSVPLDFLCFSHLRWNFVFQRPQHLLTRCARDARVFFVEEPIYEANIKPRWRNETSGPVQVLTPHLPEGSAEIEINRMQRTLLDELIDTAGITDYVAWYYTPLALAFTDHLSPLAIVYDCMDELSAFKGAPAALKVREAELMRRASLVLTGGRSLFEAKRHQHPNIHLFPSSVDAAHFARARRTTFDPADQSPIPHPRLGFFGVIDERMDLPLLDEAAAIRPDWHFVMLGPVVKIDVSALPRRANIHYLGSKTYAELPDYIAGWDVALLPFARNEATRFISPTKTPEYLAAGKPVVSTSITDVVRPYARLGLVHIADEAEAFIGACEAALTEDHAARLLRADAFLRQTSWDGTWLRIRRLLDAVLGGESGEHEAGLADRAAG